MDTLATTGWSMDTQPSTGWSMDTQTSIGWPMDTQATTGWSMGNLSLQSIRDTPNSVKRRYSPTGSFGSSDESSDQEQVFQHEMGKILVFRVDRCKIERLILGQFEPIKETAGDYFLRIGNETGTTVIWPQKLKIGIKKGKNPDITICGPKYEGVMLAKKIILEHFYCTNIITLKMDVSNTGHSHIIGKGGKIVNSIMSEMDCRIHFPDSNLSNPNEKNNKVSISGDVVKGIEKARAKVRELVPLVLTFDFLDTNFNANDPLLRSMQDQFNIKLKFLPKANQIDTTTAVIKGYESEAGHVKEATQLLIDHISGKKGYTSPVTMNMEISPSHHSFVLGQNNVNIQVIMHITNTNILFPDAADSNILPIKKGSVSITGKFDKSF